MFVAGVTSDRLYPLRLRQQLADLIPTASQLCTIESEFGHDGVSYRGRGDFPEVVTQTVSAARTNR